MSGPQSPRLARGFDQSAPTGFGPYTAPILWILHGWLAMFFLGAGYAKVFAPAGRLPEIMIWPAHAPSSVVVAVGIVEMILATAVASPLLSTRLGRLAALGATVVLMFNALFMTVFYVLAASPGPALVNAALIGLGGGLLLGHRVSQDARSRR